MNIIDKYHVIRRGLLIVFTYFFLKITYHLFYNGATLDAFKVSAYGIFAGIETLLIKFYLNSRSEEMKYEPKTMVDIKKPD